LRNARDHLRERNVFQRGEFREQVVELIDDADAAQADFRAPRVRQLAR
jgi:hypothetical protein